jgi:succinate dehydrogenase/fumarate reductase-like Fe-S protein
MKNEKKQTAVEWFVKELNQKIDFIPLDKWDMIRDIIQQAKEMDKERMKGMYVEGSFAKMRYYDGLEYIDAEQYYNETYGENEQ